MDHPNIAKVLDGGATETGRPYFVMELVRGQRITDYCDQNNLSTEQRLELFMQLCHAIQHAHQKGIIHRDIKPSNILVTVVDGRPVPKVIDFGIAKATHGQLTDQTVYTQLHQFIGTPVYMSPEQAALSGVDVDTRSDVYSLGVLLYELLTGHTPFEAKTLVAAGLDEMRRIIREQEPPRPSARISTLAEAERTTVAKHRHSEPTALRRLVRGDLDWIVMKCLEKDRGRRYETANNIASDVEHHLRHEPVQASPPGRMYRARKFVRRHRVGVAMAGAVTLALAIGLAAALIGFGQAERERDKAQAEAAKSQQVARFLEDMLQSVGPSVALGRDTTMLQEILDKTAERVGKDLANRPEVQAELRTTIGNTYLQLGKTLQADAMMREALRLRRSLNPGTNEAVAEASYHLATLLARQGGRACLAEAESLLRQVLVVQRELLGARHTKVANSLVLLAGTLFRENSLAEAEAVSREALAMRRELAGGTNLPVVASSLDNLALILREQGKLGDAEAAIREALAIQRKVLGNEAVDVATSLYYLGGVLHRANRLAEAEATYREAWTLDKKLYGEASPYTREALSGLITVVLGQGKLAEAQSLRERRELAFREALARARGTFGNKHREVERALVGLADVLTDQGKLDEAETLSGEEVALEKELSGERHLFVANSLQRLGHVLELRGNLNGAEAAYREELAIRRERLGGESPEALKAAARLAGVLQAQGKAAEADSLRKESATRGESNLREALARARKTFGNKHREVDEALCDLARCLVDQRKLAEAEAVWREELALERGLSGERHPWAANSLRELGEVLELQNKLAEAESVLREALAIQREKPGTELHLVIPPVVRLARVLEKQGKLGEAEALSREAVSLRRKHYGDKHREVDNALVALARVLLKEGKVAEAEAVRREESALEKELSGERHPSFAVSLAELATLLLMQEKYAEAEPVAHQCLAIREEKIPDSWATFYARSLLGASLLGQKKYAEAEPLLVAGHMGMKEREDKIPASNKPRLKEARQHLVRLYAATGQPEKIGGLQAALSQSYRTRLERLRQEARGDDPNALNSLAWFLATCPEATIRDGAEAVRLAEKAVTANHRQSALYLDTLAAAYAEAGQFDKAVAVEKETIALSTSDRARQAYASRLKLYESNKPYRERE